MFTAGAVPAGAMVLVRPQCAISTMDSSFAIVLHFGLRRFDPKDGIKGVAVCLLLARLLRVCKVFSKLMPNVDRSPV